jgi:hypothetical protein
MIAFRKLSALSFETTIALCLAFPLAGTDATPHAGANRAVVPTHSRAHGEAVAAAFAQAHARAHIGKANFGVVAHILF